MMLIKILFSILLHFNTLNPSSSHSQAILAANNSSDVLYDLSPFIKIYKNNTVERLIGTGFVPPSDDDPTTGVRSKDVVVSSTPNVTARVFLPRGANPSRKLPLLIFFHGGAFFTESAASPTYHTHLNSVVSKANVVAVSVNYRLAPENPLPAGYQDSWLAMKWALSKGSDPWLRDYVNFEHVYLGGDSAGANIAHNVAVQAGLRGLSFDGLFLNCPHFWGKNLTKEEASDVQIRTLMENIWVHAYPNSKGFDDPMLNPAMDPNLAKIGCKRVLVYVAGKDILKGRGWYYKESLEKSGWSGKAQVVEVSGEEHDFGVRFPGTPNAVKLVEGFGDFLNHVGGV